MSQAVSCRFSFGLVFSMVVVGFVIPPAGAGTITGRREGQFGEDIHESYVWFTGVGSNASNQWAIAFTWGGDFTVNNVPAGQYHVAGNTHGNYRYNMGATITVPASGTVDVQLRDRNTMASEGLADVGECDWAAQEFVATGTDVAQVMILSPNGGSQVRVTIREDNPWGAQIGPLRLETNGSLFPAFSGWDPDEVPTVPGRRYVVRIDRDGPGPWRPCVSYRRNPYPNGGAWFDGLYRPEADLRIAVACRDDGLVADYKVNNWWRSNTFTELVQSFVATGEEMRIAQIMPAGQDSFVMRASVHEWSGSYPYGAQVGFAKYAKMSASLLQGFVWGSGEAVLSPGQRYALRFVRADGQPFSMYGDSDEYSQGQAYFDGVAENGIDITGRVVTREVDRGEIVLSGFEVNPISATEIEATFGTDVETVATLCYATGTPVFETIEPAGAAASAAHQVIARHLVPGASYSVSVLAHHPARNVFHSSPVLVTLPTTSAALTGEVFSQVGPVAGAFVWVEEADVGTKTNAQGGFSFAEIPTGRYTLSVEAIGCETVSQEVDVTPDGQASVLMEMVAYTNLLAGTDDDPISGWTEFGEFDGQWNSGDWSVESRSGPKWVGSVQNGTGGKKGGIYRTIATETGKDYVFAGWVYTDAFGSSYDPIPGLAAARIGVDPTGGTDPAGPFVVWGRYRFTDGQWLGLEVPFTAMETEATLFCQHNYETFYLLAPWWIVGFDDLWVGLPLPPIPDFDRDGDVDLTDFGHFQACYSGAGNSDLPPGCDDARLDTDDDIDLDDFALFQNCLSGTGVPYDADCID